MGDLAPVVCRVCAASRPRRRLREIPRSTVRSALLPLRVRSVTVHCLSGVATTLPGMRPRQLFVLRHAKSSWDDPDVEDFDRPLAPRGQRDAAGMAGQLAAAGPVPELVLCSPARRTRETL